MGLDSVEIVMKVEKNFGIKIPDRQAEKILTVGDFHNTVWELLEVKHSDRCKSQGLFYQLRKLFVDRFNLAPTLINPALSPENIFPVAQRRQEYFALSKTMNLDFPKLQLTSGWGRLLNIFGFTAILGSLAVSIILINFFDYSKATLLSLIPAILLTIVLSKVLEPKRTKIPASTIRNFTEEVLVLNYARILNDAGTNRKEMEMVINKIIVNMAGVEPEEVTPEKKLGDDLGID